MALGKAPELWDNIIKQASNGRVVLHKLPISVSDPMAYDYRLACMVCMATKSWHIDAQVVNALGAPVDTILEFCEAHKHEKFIPGAGETHPIPAANPSQQIKFFTYQTPLNTPDTVTSFKIPAPVGAGLGYKAETVSLSQEQMKQVWQWSDFNVDLQANNLNGVARKFRAVCNVCKTATSVEFINLNKNIKEDWDKVREFCFEHRVHTEPGLKGRKFKDV